MQWDLGKIWGDGWFFYVPTIAIFLGGCCWEWFKSYQPKMNEFDIGVWQRFVSEKDTSPEILFRQWFQTQILIISN